MERQRGCALAGELGCGRARVVPSGPGVNGEDLLSIRDAEESCRDLKVTPFVARKVLSLRDQCAS